MPDDPTGRPKPTTRRRRQPKSGTSASAAGVPPTAGPNGLGVDPTLHFNDHSGRPIPAIDHGELIREVV